MKSVFPVHRLSGLKWAYWNLFFHIFQKHFFLPSPHVHSSSYKHEIEKKNPDRPTGRFFYSPGGQETIIHLRVA